MTANINQHVTLRYRRPLQRGRITHATLTAAFGVSTLVVIALLGFFYLQQVLHTASEGTDVHTLEAQLLELKQHQRELELEGANLRSLQTVEDHVQKLNLGPTSHVTYLTPTPDHVAAIIP